MFDAYIAGRNRILGINIGAVKLRQPRRIFTCIFVAKQHRLEKEGVGEKMPLIYERIYLNHTAFGGAAISASKGGTEVPPKV